ncbi:tyrosine-protein kinase hopscotch [Scaptodrosophila lebanonensis]|uniref:non-specific protein-tyrosine kinase n=1 Tax=Drosophila lebanonensis TaxID=7225 RepID=A0A6J2TYJ5_DROLE|nr:tyrosine-protein kinase hopscotch [Scaptodrosophila lebanonensis]
MLTLQLLNLQTLIPGRGRRRSMDDRGNNSENGASDGLINVYNYHDKSFFKFRTDEDLYCEKICILICKTLKILPTAQLLFGICEHEATGKQKATETATTPYKWLLPDAKLSPGVRYYFRMRFKVPELDRQLELIDVHSHDYLYYQMLHDVLEEHIEDMRYPNHKNKTMGLAAMSLRVDMLEKGRSQHEIEREYKKYLTESVKSQHFWFVRHPVIKTFRKLVDGKPTVADYKWHYIHEIYNVAPNYMTEVYKAKVDYLPNEQSAVVGGGGIAVGDSISNLSNTLTVASNVTLTTNLTNGGRSNTSAGSSRQSRRHGSYNSSLTSAGADNKIPVYVKLSTHDSPEPGLKVARVTSDATLQWMSVAVVEDIFTLYQEEDNVVRMEIVGLPKGYRLHFNSQKDTKSFLSYISIYIRLTVRWMQNTCPTYTTPSLEELLRLNCHGPIGASYSFMKLHDRGNKCGSFIVRQCDLDYSTYYIDINTRVVARTNHHERCQTETFKITRSDNKWHLVTKEKPDPAFDQLTDIANYIHAESETRTLIHPSTYDKPPLLLLCLPKNLKAKKTNMVLSETELQRRNPQIFNPLTDLLVFVGTIGLTGEKNVYTMRGEWIQQGSFKDVPVTLKFVHDASKINEFFDLSSIWTSILSPQFVKLYGITVSRPYTMVMEYSEHGQLNRFLKNHSDVSLSCLLELMRGLVGGIHYLKDHRIIHSYIRCANMFVTKYDPKSNELVAKIGDPGFPRPYTQSDLAWIPSNYYRNLELAKKDHSTQFWAFATTVWEIFARGNSSLERLTQEDLIKNKVTYANILKSHDHSICPPEIELIIMDGWNEDPDKRFNHLNIYIRLNVIKNRIERPDYESPDAEVVLSDTNSQGSRDDDNNDNDNDENNESAQTVGHNPMMLMERGPIFPFNCDFICTRVLLVEDGKVIYQEKDVIGEGHYGCVYRGKLELNDPSCGSKLVAIKKLKTVKVANDFDREISIMSRLNHPNVVNIRYWDEKSLSIIMDYYELGSFSVYLKSRKPNPADRILLRYALDIAKGMNYLAEKNVIHRDLAARNILVDHDKVKISDFGLAQIANSDGYYIAMNEREIPIKWYSPEAIETNKFSLYSDVWSYGVTLIEIFSRGEVPVLDKDKQDPTKDEFLNSLKEGRRFPQPEDCPMFVYRDLMLPCWNAIPKERPKFSELVKRLQQEIGQTVSIAAAQQQQQQQQLQANHLPNHQPNHQMNHQANHQVNHRPNHQQQQLQAPPTLHRTSIINAD